MVPNASCLQQGLPPLPLRVFWQVTGALTPPMEKALEHVAIEIMWVAR